jgi:hypothetical protein
VPASEIREANYDLSVSHYKQLVFDDAGRAEHCSVRRKKNATEEYEVGYSKPPQHTRFKPGQSGNPKGRPKRSKNLRSVLDEALFKKIAVTEDGRLRTMSRMEALVTALVAKGLKGDIRATESLLKLASHYCAPGDKDRPQVVK